MNNLVSVRNDEKWVDFSKKFNRKIDEKIGFIEREIQDNDKIQDYVSGKIVEQKIIKKYTHKFDVSKLDFSYELNEFLKCQSSNSTISSYKHCIMQFYEYCQNNEIDIFEIKTKEVDGFLNYLNNLYGSRSVRLKMAGIQSFFKFLIYRYPESFLINPFNNRKLPKILDVYKKDFVTENDIKEIKREFKRIGREDIICGIDLMVKYGFRVGIFKNMEVRNDGNWESFSKGKGYKGKFLKNEVKRINESGLLKLSTVTITNIIKKYTHKLFEKQVLSCEFSVHDLRRFFIMKGMRNCKNGVEILNFSRKIHKNISTTFGYL
jgi:integrase